MSGRAGTDGLLIVNADDWGLDPATTDAILEAFHAGRVTSATAMVWMADSPRAADIGRDAGLPMGLHLNLIEPYTDRDMPPAARERQARVAAYFRRSRLARWSYNPRIARDVDACVADQLEQFRELFGREPTHADGHRHVHLCPNVLLSRSLGELPRLRPSFTFDRGEKPLYNRAVRRAFNHLIARRFAAPDRFYSIRTLVPALGGASTERLRQSEWMPVEVMSHPGWEDERRYLASPAWVEQLDGLPLGSYADLRRR